MDEVRQRYCRQHHKRRAARNPARIEGPNHHSILIVQSRAELVSFLSQAAIAGTRIT